MLPFDLRLENPPADFVGREAEIAALKAALKDGPLAALHGPSGMGKSTVVQALLARRRARRPPLRLTLVEPAHERVLEALRRAAEVTGRPPMGGPEAFFAAALELAEDGGWWVVVEDSHVVPTPLRVAWLEMVAQHARRSRWIFVGWRPTPTSLPVPQVAIDGLPEPALRALVAGRTQVEASGLDAAIRASGGSPLAAVQHAAGHGADPWAVADAEAATAVDLAAVDIALPRALVGPSDDLVRRGLVQQTPAGLRAHSAAVSAWRARHPDAIAARRPTLADALVESSLPTLQIEGLRLLALAGSTDALRAALARRCSTLLEAGFVLGLWRAIQGALGVDRWRLEVAAQLGTADALAWLPEDPPESPSARWWWALCWMLRGDPARAFPVAAALYPKNVGAGLTAASCLMNLGRYEEAEVRLRDHPELDDWAIRRALCLVQLGRRVEAHALAVEIRGRVAPRVASTNAIDVFELARVFLDLGALEAGATLLDAIPPARISGREAVVRLARHHIAMVRGEFSVATALESGLAPYAQGGLLGPSVAIAQLQSALYLGQLQGFPARLQRLRDSALDGGPVGRYCAALAAEHGRLLGAPPGDPPEMDVYAGPRWVRWAARHGRAPTTRWEAPPDAKAGGDLAVVEHTLATGGWADPRPVVALAAAAGFGMVALQSQCVVCEAAVIAGDRDMLAAALDSLEPMATGAARFEGELRFYRWCLEPADLGELEALAGLIDVAPVAARRALHLLGEACTLDAVDVRVVGDLPAVQRLIPGGAPGWGVDLVAAQVWRPEGLVDLAGRPVALALLTALVGGAQDKESLVQAIWDEPYHPLHHDNRLQAAVRALRTLVEIDPGTPARILTTDAGYALGGPCGLRAEHAVRSR